MVEIVVNKRKAVARQSEILTSGSVGIPVSFSFSQDWEGLSRTAVFSNGSVTRDVVLYGTDCVIPHECLVASGKTLTVGVYGTDGETIVIPTVYCALGRVLQGADPSGDPSIPPTPTAVQQIMSAAANAVNIAQSVRNDADAGAFDGTDGYSPSVTISDIEGGHRVTITDEAHPQGQSFDVLDGQGGGGTGDHRQLTHRDAADQHPMSAITGLVSALAGKQATISDLATIRSGAAAGATAVQPETGKGLFSGSYNDLTNKPTIPSALSQLSADAAHRTVTDAEKETWNAKSDFSGAYADLTGKPTIPDELADLASDSTHRTVTDTEKETWNAKGTYSKPSSGIPKADLATAVQTSLGLADSALQQHQSLAAYRTATAQDVIDATKADKPTIKTAMDAVATVNTMYFLGAQSAVSIVLPSGASAGDQLSVVWYNGATAATLSITGTVLTVDYTPSANSRSELNAMWDGTYWAVVTNEQEVPA